MPSMGARSSESTTAGRSRTDLRENSQPKATTFGGAAAGAATAKPAMSENAERLTQSLRGAETPECVVRE